MWKLGCTSICKGKIIVMTSAPKLLIVWLLAFQAGSLHVWDRDFLLSAEKWEISQRSLGQTALQRARGADVQGYAHMVVDDHARTLQQLKDLMKKKGVSQPGLATEADVEGAHRLDSVSGAADFDREYISLMTADTQQWLKRFNQAAETADDRAVRAYASAVVPILEKEQQQAADLEKKMSKQPAR
jgi:predicted outer membrane protein